MIKIKQSSNITAHLKNLAIFSIVVSTFIINQSCFAETQIYPKAQAVTSQEDDYISLGSIYFNNKMYENAIEYYNFALKLNPSNEYVIYQMAKSWFELEDYVKAKDFIMLAINLNPSNSDYKNLLLQLQGEQNFEPATSETIIRYDEIYYNKQGLELFNDNNYDNAKKYFQKAIEINPKSATAYNNLGNIEYQQGNLPEAVKLCKKAVQTNPNYFDAYFNLALIYEKQGDKKNQKKCLDKVLALNPENNSAYLERAFYYYKKGDFNKAKKDLTVLLNNPQCQFEANYYLGLIYANSYDFYSAVKYLKTAFKLKNNTATCQKLAQILNTIDKNDEAIEYLNKAIALEPNNASLYSDLGKIYLLTNNLNKAEKSFKKALTLDKNNLDCCNFLAVVYFKQDNFELSRDLLIQTIKMDNKRPIFHYNLSQCYAQLKDTASAQKEFQAAISITPERLSEYVDLIKIYSLKKMDDNALKMLKEASKKYPNAESLNLILTSTYRKNK